MAPRRVTGQIRVDEFIEELVESTARRWAAQADRSVTKQDAAIALIRCGVKHDAEAFKLLP